MVNLTEDSLGVFWLFEDGHEEVTGILAYGFFYNIEQNLLAFPYDLWPVDTLVKVYIYEAETWKIIEWTIHFNEWPKQSEWEQIIGGTLKSFIDSGAAIAWCGLEGTLATPPSLFCAREMSRSVYAILIPGNDLICSAHLQKPFQTVSDEDLFTAKLTIEQLST